MYARHMHSSSMTEFIKSLHENLHESVSLDLFSLPCSEQKKCRTQKRILLSEENKRKRNENKVRRLSRTYETAALKQRNFLRRLAVLNGKRVISCCRRNAINN